MGDLSWPLARAAQLHGARTAVRDGDRTVADAELARRVDALGTGLPAGHIGVLAANSLAHLECWLAIPAHGRVIVDLNHRLAPEELGFIAEDAGLELLLADAERLPVARAIASCPVLDIGHAPRVAPQPPPDHAPDTLAAISYTGGTTGTPKGVMLSHGNLVANALHNLVATGHGAEDRWLHVPWPRAGPRRAGSSSRCRGCRRRPRTRAASCARCKTTSRRAGSPSSGSSSPSWSRTRSCTGAARSGSRCGRAAVRRAGASRATTGSRAVASSAASPTARSGAAVRRPARRQSLSAPRSSCHSAT